jgi:putative ABC transport system ATP-binding protein
VALGPLLRAEGLEVHYRMGDELVRALDGVTLDIGRGEYVAITGSSGSGKTTLMHVLGCLGRPSAGRYELAGVDVASLSDDALSALRSQHIGFVFQNFQLLPRETALSNVALPLVYRGVAGRERTRRAKEALERVGLGHRMGHRPAELSGGQRQRVAIARALVGAPSLLLADEPTGNLDSGTGAGILRMLGELHAAGNTVVLVTHEPSIAAQAPRAVRVADGRIVDDGPGDLVAASMRPPQPGGTVRTAITTPG